MYPIMYHTYMYTLWFLKGKVVVIIKATLRDLLVQPDCVNLKYEAGLPNNTVFCERSVHLIF